MSEGDDGYTDCPDPRCVSGSTIERQYIERITSLLLLAGADGARKKGTDKRHPYFDDLDKIIGLNGTANEDMAVFTTGLAGRPPSPFGHDVIDQHMAVKKILKAAGLPENWGTCQTCKGDGTFKPASKSGKTGS